MALRSKVGLEPLKSEIPTEPFSLESLSSKMGCHGVLLLSVYEGFFIVCFFFFCFGNAKFRTLFCKEVEGDKWWFLRTKQQECPVASVAFLRTSLQ